jgi:GxxExxY protein
MREPDSRVNQLANAVIGAALEVHRELGPGFLEAIYEKALCHELTLRNIAYVQQAEVNMRYKGFAVGEGRIDILVENRLVVELKAVDVLVPVHKAQVISYLKATNLLLGLLINFNVPILKNGIQRIIMSQ